MSEERRGPTFGIFKSSQGLSFVVGPLIGVAIAELASLRAPFSFDFALTLLAVALFALLFGGEALGGHGEFDLGALAEVVRDRELLKTAHLGFSEGFSFAAWSSFLPAYMPSLEMGEAEIGAVLSLVALAFSLPSVLVGYLSDGIGRRARRFS